MKSLHLSMKSKLLFFIYINIGLSLDGEIVPLSSKVGSDIDPIENIYFNIFPDIKGFVSAQFYQINDDEFIAQIDFMEYTHERISKRSFSLRKFIELQNFVNKQEMISDYDRKNISGELTYLETDNIIQSIPINQFVVIKHKNDKKIYGTMKSYDGSHIEIQTPVNAVFVPIWELERISYRPTIIEKTNWKWKIVGLTALSGLLVSEFWNLQTNPRTDIQWYLRFLGITIGLFSASEAYDTVNILFSPMTSFGLTPNEINLIKHNSQE